MIQYVFWSLVYADPVLSLGLSSRELLQIHPKKGDTLIRFTALKVSALNVFKNSVNETVKEKWTIFGLKCKRGRIWSPEAQGCGQCPNKKRKLSPVDAERMQALGTKFHIKRCNRSGPGSCSCVVFYKTTNRRGRSIWKKTRLGDVMLHVANNCLLKNAIRPGKKPRGCFKYKKLSNMGLNQKRIFTVVLPELHCVNASTGENITYARNVEFPPVYITPSTRTDSVYHMMRFQMQFGFESDLTIMESLSIRENVATFLFINEIVRQGNAFKVGPSLRELQDHCSIRLNVFLNKKGRALENNAFISAASIQEKQEVCSADGMQTVVSSYQRSLAVLKNLTELSHTCVEDDEVSRRLTSEPAKNTNADLGLPKKIFGQTTNAFRLLSSKPAPPRQLLEAPSHCLMAWSIQDRPYSVIAGMQTKTCCRNLTTILCGDAANNCTENGNNITKPDANARFRAAEVLCSDKCQVPVLQGLQNYSMSRMVAYSWDQDLNGKIDWCEEMERATNEVPTMGPRQLPQGLKDECHPIHGLSFIGPQVSWCCEAFTNITANELLTLGMGHLLGPHDIKELPDEDVVADAWRQICITRDGYCGANILSGLQNYTSSGRQTEDPQTGEMYMQQDVGPNMWLQFDRNFDGTFDACSHVQEQTITPTCSIAINEAVNSDLGRKCYRPLTGRKDGQLLATCKPGRVVSFDQVRISDSLQDNTQCQDWLCSEYMANTFFTYCSNSPTLVCCGAGNVTKLLDFCPGLAATYKTICPNGCEGRQLDCDVCHESCDGCLNDHDQHVCHMRCDYDECGEGDPSVTWELYDGMSCDNQQHILKKMMETALQRSFLFTGMDVYSGCKSLLNEWTTEVPVVVSKTIDGCTFRERDDNGTYNRNWLDDPCCNRDMARKQCCSPRTIDVQQMALDINITAISLYHAMTNAGHIALEVAQAYSEKASEVAQTCFKPYFTFMNSTNNQNALIKQCLHEVQGRDFDRKHGASCTTDSDCWTEECATPAISGEDQMSSETSSGKFCRVPMDTEKKDVATPLMKCLMETSAPQVLESFKFRLGLNQTAETGEVAQGLIRTIPGITHFKCEGREHKYWLLKTQEDCEATKQCNWDWNKAGAMCTDPCGGDVDNPKCPNYCGSLTNKWEVSQFPQCVVKMKGGDVQFYEECWASLHVRVRTAKEACLQCEDVCTRSRANRECWKACDTTVCKRDWSFWDTEFDRCFDAKCKERDPKYAVFTQQHRRRCIDPSLSFDNSHEAACKESCYSNGGPQPKGRNRCYAILDADEAKHDVCSSFGEAWMEERTGDMTDAEWDWSLGPPPPRWCWLRGYEVLNGEPYKRPPAFGPACLNSCEKELHQCFNPEKCWQWFQNNNNNRQTRCEALFEDYRVEFETCMSGNANCADVVECRSREYACMVVSGLAEDERFKALECADCHGEWRNEDNQRYQCLSELENVNCRWNITSAAEGVSQPCAWGCMGTCLMHFDNCDKTDKLECETDVRKLNQCRECTFVICDEARCQHKCDNVTHFESWERPKDFCLGCDENSAAYQCAPNKDCFSDRTCFGGESPFGNSCTIGCENQLKTCKLEKRGHCDAMVETGWWLFKKKYRYGDVCTHFWKLLTKEIKKCVDKKMHHKKDCWKDNACQRLTKQYLAECRTDMKRPRTMSSEYFAMWDTSAPANCFDCSGEWNMDDPWLFEHGAECVSAPSFSACKDSCVLTTCDKFDVNCEDLVQTARQCTSLKTNKRRLDRKDDDDNRHHEWREVCKVSYLDAINTVTTGNSSCSGCQFSKCEHVCRHPCDRRPSKHDRDKHEFYSFYEVLQSCSKCTLNQRAVNWAPDVALCAPGANCYLDQTFDWSTGTPPDSWFAEQTTCFPNKKKHERHLSEIEAANLDSTEIWGDKRHLSSLLEQMVAPSRENYHAHMVFTLQRSLEVVSPTADNVAHRRRLQHKIDFFQAKPRRLVGEQPESVRLDLCVGDCPVQQQLCTAFWQRDVANSPTVSDEQKLINTVLDKTTPYRWNEAPWENNEQRCVDNKEVCFISLDQAKLDTFAERSFRCDRWESQNAALPANEQWLAPCLATNCLGCVDSSLGSCHTCCQCHSDLTIRQAAGLSFRGGNYLCELLRTTFERGFMATNSSFDIWNIDQRRTELYRQTGMTRVVFDDSFLEGAGACKHRIRYWKLQELTHGTNCSTARWRPECQVVLNTSSCATSNFAFYGPVTHWQKGTLDTEAKCEAERCDPEPWVTSKEQCESINYCRGDCPYCETLNFYDRDEAMDKIICTLTTPTGDLLTADECTKAGAAAAIGEEPTTFHLNNKTNRGICKTDPPMDGSGETDRSKCHGVRIHPDGTEYFFTLLSCSDLHRLDCKWAGAEFPDMECTVQRLQCKTMEDCHNAGRCGYHNNDRLVEQDDGICMVPFDLSAEFDQWEGMQVDLWQQCEEERSDNLVGTWSHVGCALFLAQSGRRILREAYDSRLAMTNRLRELPRNLFDRLDEMGRLLTEDSSSAGSIFSENVDDDDQEFSDWESDESSRLRLQPGSGITKEMCTHAGAKWIPHAQSKSECELPGYMWEKNTTTGEYGSGTMSCCVDWVGTSGQEDCLLFSQETSTEDACNDCGGKWMGVFRFVQNSRWIVGRWKIAYVWKERKLENKNAWMQTLQTRILGQEWDKVIYNIQAGPARNLAICRAGSMLDFIQSITSQQVPQISLGTAEAWPLVARTDSFGNFRISSSETTCAVKTDVDLSTESAGSVTINFADRRRLLRTKPSGRRLVALDRSALPASCWTVVLNSDDQRVGQLIGDCLDFAPSVELSGPMLVCMKASSNIQIDPDFTKYDFATKLNGRISPLDLTMTLSNEGSVCGDLQEKGVYCPILRLPVFEGGSVVSYGNECVEMDQISASVSTTSETIRNSAEFLEMVAASGLLLAGQTAEPSDELEGDATFGETGLVDLEKYAEAANDTTLETIEATEELEDVREVTEAKQPLTLAEEEAATSTQKPSSALLLNVLPAIFLALQ